MGPLRGPIVVSTVFTQRPHLGWLSVVLLAYSVRDDAVVLT